MGRVAHISFVSCHPTRKLSNYCYLFSRRHEIINNTSSFLTVLTSLPTLLSTFASSCRRRLDYVHNQQSMYLEHLLDNSGEHYLTALHYSLCTFCDSSSSPSGSSETHEFRFSNWRRFNIVEKTRIYMPIAEGIRARNPFASVPWSN